MARPRGGILRIEVIADSARAIGEFKRVDQAVGRMGKSFGDAADDFSRFSAGMAAAVGGVAVVSVKAFDSLTIANKRLERSFGESAKEFEDWGRAAADTMGMSQRAAIEAASGFGLMFKAVGLTGKAVVPMSKALVTLTADLAAASGGTWDQAQAQEAVQATFRGEYDSIQRLLPGITAMAVETEALAISGKENAKQLTAQERMQATYNLVLRDGAIFAGAYGDKAATSTGKIAELSAKIENFLAKVGEAVAPVLIETLDSITAFFDSNPTVISDFASWADEIVIFTAAIAGLGAALKVANLAAGIGTLIVAHPVIAGITLLAGAVFLLGEKLDVDWKAKVEELGTAMDDLKPHVDGIGAALNDLKFVWDVGEMTKSFETLKTAIGGVASFIGEVWGGLTGTLTLPFRLAWGVIQAIWGGFSGWVSGMVGAVQAIWSNLLNIITMPFRIGFQVALSVLRAIPGAFSAVLGVIRGIWSAVTSVISAPFIAGINIIKSAFNGLKSFVGGVIAGVKRVWNSALAGRGFDVPSWVPFIGGNSFRFPALAAGGIVTKPTIALVGEAGPEAVIPLDRMRRNEGTVVNITVNVPPTADAASVGREIAAALSAYVAVGGRVRVA